MWRVLLLAFLATGVAHADDFAAKALANFSRTCEPEGMRLWGKSVCGPIVLVDPSTRAAIANRPDPDGKFHSKNGLFTGVFPERFTPSNTSIHWGDEDWATVLLPLPSDPFTRLALLAHESFHRIQPGLGLTGSDAPNAHLDTEAGRIWLRLELRALSRALRLRGKDARRSAADAMLFRLNRHRLLPGSEAMEAAMEKQEGLSEYTGMAIALRETGEDIARVARIVETYEDSDALARSFAYATGPALGLLLDRYSPGWQAQARSAALDSLLIEALHLSPEPAEARAASYGYRAVAATEKEREQRHQALLAELTAKFIDGPVLEFPKAPQMNRSFNPQTLVPFPPHGVYYPAGTFSAVWGRLEVQSGGALVAPDNRSLRVAAPRMLNGEPLQGDGWVLRLAPGWTIQPSDRKGSLVIAPAH